MDTKGANYQGLPPYVYRAIHTEYKSNSRELKIKNWFASTMYHLHTNRLLIHGHGKILIKLMHPILGTVRRFTHCQRRCNSPILSC